jgi:hypothetical protein
MEEVLDNPSLNTEEYLYNRSKEMINLPINDLTKLAEKGKNKKNELESENIDKIHKKYHVS